MSPVFRRESENSSSASVLMMNAQGITSGESRGQAAPRKREEPRDYKCLVEGTIPRRAGGRARDGVVVCQKWQMDPVYDLGGRRVSSEKLSNGLLNRGVYINGHQKVVKWKAPE